MGKAGAAAFHFAPRISEESKAMNRICCWATALCLLPVTGYGAEITISLPQASSVERNVVTYSCPGRSPMTVEYINAGDNALALVPVEGASLVFAGVLSASGARYAAGPYIWWTKGGNADLYDLRQGDAASPIACRETAGE